jgi:hypothetical protein
MHVVLLINHRFLKKISIGNYVNFILKKVTEMFLPLEKCS